MEEQNKKKNWIIKNLLGAVLFFVALAVVANILLAVFTHHNRVITVPDMTGLSLQEAQQGYAPTHEAAGL